MTNRNRIIRLFIGLRAAWPLMPLLILGGLLFLHCAKKEIAGIEKKTETGVLSGVLLMEDGTKAKGATVELLIDDTAYNTAALAKTTAKIVELEITNEQGEYTFTDLDSNTYHLNAYMFVDGDTLTYYRPDILFVESKDLGNGTLVSPGKCSTIVVISDNPAPGVECYIPGASFLTITDNAGMCVISGIPPGTYDIAYRRDNYLIETVADVIIQPAATTPIPDVTLKADPGQDPPEPTNLSAVYNADSGIVFLSWSPVEVSDIEGYRLYRDDTAATSFYAFTADLVKDTLYRDTMPDDIRDTVYQYRVKAQDRPGNQSGFVMFEQVAITPINKPGSPIPANGASDRPLSLELGWSEVTASETDQSVLYDVYIDPLPDPRTIASRGQSQRTLAVSNLIDNKAYYWKVVARVSGKDISGPVWRFSTKKNPNGNTPPNRPAKPNPADRATGQNATALTLHWTGGDPDASDKVSYDIYLGTNESNIDKIATGRIDTSYPVIGLLNNTTYYWRVSVSDGQATRIGPTWSFKTRKSGVGNPPDKPSNPSPGDNATDTEILPTLSWTGGDPDKNNEVTYFVFLNPDSNFTTAVASGISATSYETAPLMEGMTYYWKIITSDGLTTTHSDVWTFTTKASPIKNKPPHIPSTPSPANNSDNQGLSKILSWKGGDPNQADTALYKIKFGTRNPPEDTMSDLQDTATWMTPPLQTSTRYFWRVISTDGDASTIGPVWSFVTAPFDIDNSAPHKPGVVSPSNGRTDLDTNIILTWTGGDPDSSDTVTYEVKFGTSGNPSEVIATALTDTFLLVSELDYGTLYYWRITAADDDTSTAGPVWSFSTAPPANNPPSLTPPNDTTIAEGQTLTIIVSGSDPDSHNLTYTALAKPSGSTLSGNQFSWQPNFTQSGNHLVTVMVADDGVEPLRDTVSFTITVNDLNRAPRMKTTSDMTIGPSQSAQFSVSAADADGDALTYMMIEGPVGAGFTGQAFSWSPGQGAVGLHRVTVIVTDDGTPNKSDTARVQITVTDIAPVPPVVSGQKRTSSPRPAWSWSAPATTVAYRYQLNGEEASSWKEVSSEVKGYILPNDVSEGTHILYVQAKNRYDNWSASGSLATTVQTTLYVSKTGDDGDEGTKDSPKLTVQAAIDAALLQNVSMVRVATGAYIEDITLTGGISLYGGYAPDFDSRDLMNYETVLKAKLGEQNIAEQKVNACVYINSAKSLTVNGFTISGNASLFPTFGVRDISADEDIHIDSCVLPIGDVSLGYGARGYKYRKSVTILSNSHIYGFGNIEGTRGAVDMKRVRNCVIENLYTGLSQVDEVIDCTVKNLTNGISLTDLVQRCSLYTIERYGISKLGWTIGATVEGCYISDCDIGVYITGNNNQSFVKNSIIQNTKRAGIVFGGFIMEIKNNLFKNTGVSSVEGLETRLSISKCAFYPSEGQYGIQSKKDGYWASLEMKNNLIFTSGAGTGVYCEDKCKIANNTLIGDGAQGVGLSIASDPNETVVVNNLVTGFSIGYKEANENDALEFRNNLFHNCTGLYYDHDNSATLTAESELNDYTKTTQNSLRVSENNLVGNPLFVGANDYHLGNASPAMNAGIDASTADYGAVTDDYEGTARPVGTGYDIGAYEAQ